MFTNVGKKIKTLAQVMFYVMLAGAVVGGIALISSDDDLVPAGLVMMAGGFLFSWISALFIYGFGELIDKTSAIERNTSSGAITPATTQVQINNRIAQLDQLYATGLITPAEYAKRRAEITNNL